MMTVGKLNITRMFKQFYLQKTNIELKIARMSVTLMLDYLTD